MGGSHLDSTRQNQSCLTPLRLPDPFKERSGGGSGTPEGRATFVEFA